VVWRGKKGSVLLRGGEKHVRAFRTLLKARLGAKVDTGGEKLSQFVHPLERKSVRRRDDDQELGGVLWG